MSTERMRQLMESVQSAGQINEGYEDRVNDVAGVIRRDYPEGLTKKEFPAAIERAGKEIRPTEMRGDAQAGRNQRGVGDSRKEFIKDVAAKFKFNRDNSKANDKKARTDKALHELVSVIEDAVGSTFPDGDPFDHIYPVTRRMGIPANDILTWLDRAVSKAGMGKSYHDYIASIWDDQYGDAMTDLEHQQPGDRNYDDAKDRVNSMGGPDAKNPWK
jgi:hypothetical protein